MLTLREKWLMKQAFEAGSWKGVFKLEDWLNDMAADAVTVEMILEQEADILFGKVCYQEPKGLFNLDKG